jgi:hypothetical protein
MSWAIGCALVVATTMAGVARAQAPSEAEAFAAAARAGTARFADRAVAIAEGYRALGADAPAMGQHWIHPGLVLAGRLDPARPQVLSYAIVEGRPSLVGVAYAIPGRGAGQVPDSPAPPEAWHFHRGSVDEEVFVATHEGAGTGPGEDTRIAVLHAWVWASNPAGPFAADNWALPWLRIGATAPPDASPDAGRALSLVNVGEAYYAALIARLGQPDEAETRAIAQALATRRANVAAWLSGRPPRPYDGTDVSRLESEWAGLWEDIRRGVRQQVLVRLAPLMSGHQHSSH